MTRQPKKVLNVGTSSISKPTPLFLKYIFRTYTFLAGVWAIAAPALTEIPEKYIALIDKWIIIGAAVIHFGIKFFSFDYKMEES